MRSQQAVGAHLLLGRIASNTWEGHPIVKHKGELTWARTVGTHPPLWTSLQDAHDTALVLPSYFYLSKI